MSYQVLARKWRPSNFQQVVGQEHVLQSLINALEKQRLHHAYLFSGTRGVGKTSIARLLAKALNCEQGVSANPCGQCSSCVEIAQGNFVDLIEIDAASKTKVEDTREILDNVQYKPTRGRYKVYLIDEVHMLSRSSFNALLKTLEEPPEHVKFLFATTETQKLPVTILSRCLQFNLKALSVSSITQQLIHILQQESMSFDDGAISMLANAADGSMRDALSLTDQAISYCDDVLTQADVQLMLGTLDPNYSLKILHAVLAQDSENIFELLEEINSFAPDYDKLLKQIALDLHFASMAKVVKQSIRLVDQPELLWEIANGASAELLQLLYSIVLQGRKELPWASDPRSGFEMVMLRLLAFLPIEKKNTLASEEFVVQAAPSLTTISDNEQPNNDEPELKALEAQQDSVLQQAQAIKQQSNDIMVAPTVVAPSTQPNEAEAVPNESSISPLKVSDKPNDSMMAPAQQFSEEELLNMSMAMAHEEHDIAPVDLSSTNTNGSVINNQSNPTNQPITGIDQFLKARRSLKDKVKATSDSGTSVKKTEAVKDQVTPEPLLRKMVPSPVAVADAIDESQDVIGQVTKLPVEATPVIDDGHAASLVVDPATLLAPNTEDYWSNLLDSMSVGGRIRQLGIHSSYQLEGSVVTLTLASAHRHLGVETAVQTMQKNLCLILDTPIELVVNIGEADQKTPFTIAQELHQLRLGRAVTCIEQDPTIVEFISNFGAAVDESSIKYRTIKAIN